MLGSRHARLVFLFPPLYPVSGKQDRLVRRCLRFLSVPSQTCIRHGQNDRTERGVVEKGDGKSRVCRLGPTACRVSISPELRLGWDSLADGVGRVADPLFSVASRPLLAFPPSRTYCTRQLERRQAVCSPPRGNRGLSPRLVMDAARSQQKKLHSPGWTGIRRRGSSSLS